MIESDIKRLAALIEFLSHSFQRDKVGGARYTNVAALLADVSLQSAMSYRNVVQPRCRRIQELHPSCRTIADLRRILSLCSVAELLAWNGQQKISLFENLVSLFEANELDSIAEIGHWVSTESGAAELLELKFFGLKSLDYFRLLCGQAVIPIDRHISRFIVLAGVTRRYNYAEAKHLIETSCDMAGVDRRIVDRGLWHILSHCRR